MGWAIPWPLFQSFSPAMPSFLNLNYWPWTPRSTPNPVGSAFRAPPPRTFWGSLCLVHLHPIMDQPSNSCILSLSQLSCSSPKPNNSFETLVWSCHSSDEHFAVASFPYDTGVKAHELLPSSICAHFPNLRLLWFSVHAPPHSLLFLQCPSPLLAQRLHILLSHSRTLFFGPPWALSLSSFKSLLDNILSGRTFLAAYSHCYSPGTPDPFPCSLALGPKLLSMLSMEFCFSSSMERKLYQAPVFFLFIFSFPSLMFQVPSAQSY